MNAVFFVAAMTVGIDVGYQELPQGGVEYIIQIEPQLLGRLAGGEDLTSEVPSELDVRRYRITVGNAVLPREAPAVRQPRAQAAPSAEDHPVMVDDRPMPRSHERSPVPELNIGEPAARGNDLTGQRYTDPVAGDGAKPDRGADLLGPRYANEPAPAAPRTLEPAPQTNPLFGRPASFDDPQSAEHQAEKRPSLEPEPGSSSRPTLEKPSESKPWLPLVMTTTVLFMSLAGNIYLGWIAWSGRVRYQALLEKFANEPVAV